MIYLFKAQKIKVSKFSIKPNWLGDDFTRGLWYRVTFLFQALPIVLRPFLMSPENSLSMLLIISRCAINGANKKDKKKKKKDKEKRLQVIPDNYIVLLATGILKVPVPKSLKNKFSLNRQIWSIFLPKNHQW